MTKYTHNVFKTAYPQYIVDTTENAIIWSDNTKMPINLTESNKLIPLEQIEGRLYSEKLNDPTLLDQISIKYIVGDEGVEKAKTVENYDPGRIRYTPFFKKMYGETKADVEKNLEQVQWLPNKFKKADNMNLYSLPISKINNVTAKIELISNIFEEKLSDDDIQYLDNPGGTFNWRNIAGTNRISGHAFGMTIDINTKYSNYWLWDYKTKHNIPEEIIIKEEDVKGDLFHAYQNQIPSSIVEVFNEQSFIWGGNWYHYDTMHFEFRPELIQNLLF